MTASRSINIAKPRRLFLDDAFPCMFHRSFLVQSEDAAQLIIATPAIAEYLCKFFSNHSLNHCQTLRISFQPIKSFGGLVTPYIEPILRISILIYGKRACRI